MPESLIISWEQPRVVVLSGSVSSSSVRIEKRVVLDWPAGTNPRDNRQASGLFLKDALRENGMTADSATVSLPREAVVLRYLQLPDLPDDELPEIVKLQAATKSAVPSDQILIDFLPLPGKDSDGLRPVMIATIDRKHAAVIRETLSAAGLELEGLGLESVGLAEIAARTATPDYGKTLLTISIAGNRLEILFLQNDNLMMMHTSVLGEGVDLEKAVIAEINRATIAAEQKVGPATIGEVVLFSDSNSDFSLLRTKYGNHFHAVDLVTSAMIQWSSQIGIQDVTATIGALCGLLLNRVQGRIPGLDFVNPRRKAVVKDDRLKQYGLYAAAGAAVVILGLYGYYSYRGKLEAAITDLKTQQAELNGTLGRGKPILESNKALREWQDRDLDLLAEIDEIQTILPGTGLAYLEQFHYDVTLLRDIAKYSAKGVATERDVVFRLYADFSNRGFAVTPQEIKSGRDPDYPTVFDLTMNRVSRPEESTRPTSSPQLPGAVPR